MGSCRGFAIGLGLVSGVINLLMLTGSLFMMQVYNRVLSSQSVSTLVALALIAAVAPFFQAWLEILRQRVLTLIGERVDARIGPGIYRAVAEMPLRRPGSPQEAMQPF